MEQQNGKKRRAAIIGLLAVLLLGVGVFGTIAWLTASSHVDNTFTVGEINNPGTDEEPGGEGGTDGTLTGNIYEVFTETEIFPGITVTKRPFIGVGANSVPAYVFAYVDNNMMSDACTEGHEAYFELGDGWMKARPRTPTPAACSSIPAGATPRSCSLRTT